jgi:hypothetical protein
VLRSVRTWICGVVGGRGAPTGSGPASSPDQAPGDERVRGDTQRLAQADAEAAIGGGGQPVDRSAESHDSSAVASRQERAAERLLEDERLRGDLTDDEFQPLLDWALAASDALAAGTAGLSDDRAAETIEAGLVRIRGIVVVARGAISAMLDAGAEGRNRELARLPDLLAPPLVGDDAVADVAARLGAALEPIMASDDLAGNDLATALAAALRKMVPATHEKDGPAA